MNIRRDLLIPYLATVKPGPVYVAEFDPPIWPPTDADGDPHRAMVEIYAGGLSVKRRRDPSLWRGWVMSHTRSPIPHKDD